MNEYDVSVFIVTEDALVIIPSEYVKQQDGLGEFVMVTNDKLNPEYNDDNTIFIHRDWVKLLIEIDGRGYFDVEHSGTYWCVDDIMLTGKADIDISPDNIRGSCYQQLNGYQQTRNVMLAVTLDIIDDYNDKYRQHETKNTYIPAIMGVWNTTADFNGKMYHGYLPAIGLLLYMTDNVVLINKAMVKIRKTRYSNQFPTTDNRIPTFREHWWSCNEYNNKYAFFLYFDEPVLGGYKNGTLKLPLPLFPIKI